MRGASRSLTRPVAAFLAGALLAACDMAKTVVESKRSGDAASVAGAEAGSAAGANATAAGTPPPTATPASPGAAPSDLPATLKELGLFDGTVDKPLAGTLPYNVRVSLWSDGVAKRRFIYVPKGKTIEYDASAGKFVFPTGTTLIKHFSRTATSGPLETRVIRFQKDGTWAYATYQWTASGETQRVYDATMVHATDGSPDYRIPGAQECALCHYAAANAMVLGFSPAQLNKLADGSSALTALDKAGILDAGVATAAATVAPRLDPGDTSLPLDQRARAYLDMNCGVCHNPSGAVSVINLTMAGTADLSALVRAGMLVPGSADQSLLWSLYNSTFIRMPPQSTVEDDLGKSLIKPWIDAMAPPGTGTATTTATDSGTATASSTATDSGTSTATDGTSTATDGGTATSGGTSTTTDGGTATSGGTSTATDGGTASTTGSGTGH